MSDRRCPDAGHCHHDCVVGCWRVENAGPLSGVYPNNEWPASVVSVTQTTDAQVWAREWCRIAREIEAADDGREVIDEGWMIGWFANAIEAGRDAGSHE